MLVLQHSYKRLTLASTCRPARMLQAVMQRLSQGWHSMSRMHTYDELFCPLQLALQIIQLIFQYLLAAHALLIPGEQSTRSKHWLHIETQMVYCLSQSWQRQHLQTAAG
jgi:hypothetical protein